MELLLGLFIIWIGCTLLEQKPAKPKENKKKHDKGVTYQVSVKRLNSKKEV